MSRILAHVVRRASGYLNLFCQLCVTMNETNYWNVSRKSIKIIRPTNRQNNLVLASVERTAKSCSVPRYNPPAPAGEPASAHPRRISDMHQVTFLPCVFLELSALSSLSWTCHLLSNMMEGPTLFWQRYLDFPGVVGNAASLAASRRRRVHYTVSATCLIKLSCPRTYCSCP